MHFKQKSEVSAAKNYLSQRLQQLFPVVLEKGSYYSRPPIRWSGKKFMEPSTLDPRQKDGLFYFAKRNETKYMGEGEKMLINLNTA